MRYTVAVLSIIFAVAACGDEDPPPECDWPKIPGANLPASFCFVDDKDPPTRWACFWVLNDVCYAAAVGPFCSNDVKFQECPPEME